MEEIEVGDYVRTKNGVIDKVDALYGMIENTVHLENQKWFDTKNIVKHSKQLIDLIEVGDFVNGEKIVEIDAYKDWIDIGSEILFEGDIKTILTKEKYMANCYKVGGKQWD